MRRWIGLLGSWALFVLALGLAAIAAAGEWINVRDSRRLERVELIDQMIVERSGAKAEELRSVANKNAAELNQMQRKVDDLSQQTNDMPDTGQSIIVSTTENRLYVRSNGQVIFQAVCSTGKGTTLAVDGKTVVFDTPIGKLHIKSKEQDPVWVPPDWHFVEEARKNGMRVVHLNPGGTVDASTGDSVSGRSEGIWSWFHGQRPTLHMRGKTVVYDDGSSQRELPPGKLITAGNTIVVPPVDSPQRQFTGVLGKYRLELGDGYGIHGTDEPDKLGHSVSHGCVRLGDADIAKLYQIARVGDEVIIY
ncbi:MAG TPA: L,D-transpeptidase [Thermoanaerobaculia bacterium]|nr:L,D-transpeptidase [Thermoanaerobaculia bacterium]